MGDLQKLQLINSVGNNESSPYRTGMANLLFIQYYSQIPLLLAGKCLSDQIIMNF